MADLALAGSIVDVAALQARRAASPLAGGVPDGDVAAVAEDFEAFFLAQMVEHMFAGMETDPLFGGGFGEGIFRSMMSQEYGKALARSGAIGLADNVASELLKLQEHQAP